MKDRHVISDDWVIALFVGLFIGFVLTWYTKPDRAYIIERTIRVVVDEQGFPVSNDLVDIRRFEEGRRTLL